MSDFMITLISAQTIYGSLCMESLVQTYRISQPMARKLVRGCAKTRDESNEGGMDDFEVEGAATDCLKRAHQYATDTLLAIIGIAPSQANSLLHVLRDKVPHVRFPASVHESFVRNILNLCLKLPRILPEVVALVIDHMVQLDVEIEDCDDDDPNQVSEDEDDEDEESLEQSMFVVDLDEQSQAEGQDWSDENGSESEDSDDDDSDDDLRQDDQLEDDPRTKLDNLMLLSFEFIKFHFLKNDDSTVKLFEILWSNFCKTLLPTFRCKHVQYLLFFMCRSALPRPCVVR